MNAAATMTLKQTDLVSTTPHRLAHAVDYMYIYINTKLGTIALMPYSHRHI